MGSVHKNTRLHSCPTLHLLYSSNLLKVICNIAISADDTIYPKCDQVSDVWKELELALEFESDLWDLVDWGRKWLVDFNAGKTQISFGLSCNTGAIDVKMDGSVLEENSAFKMVRLTFCSKLDWGSYIVSVAKTACQKIEPKFFLLCFFLLSLLCISVNLPCCHAWNTRASVSREISETKGFKKFSSFLFFIFICK